MHTFGFTVLTLCGPKPKTMHRCDYNFNYLGMDGFGILEN